MSARYTHRVTVTAIKFNAGSQTCRAVSTAGWKVWTKSVVRGFWRLLHIFSMQTAVSKSSSSRAFISVYHPIHHFRTASRTLKINVLCPNSLIRNLTISFQIDGGLSTFDILKMHTSNVLRDGHLGNWQREQQWHGSGGEGGSRFHNSATIHSLLHKLLQKAWTALHNCTHATVKPNLG